MRKPNRAPPSVPPRVSILDDNPRKLRKSISYQDFETIKSLQQKGQATVEQQKSNQFKAPNRPPPKLPPPTTEAVVPSPSAPARPPPKRPPLPTQYQTTEDIQQQPKPELPAKARSQTTPVRPTNLQQPPPTQQQRPTSPTNVATLRETLFKGTELRYGLAPSGTFGRTMSPPPVEEEPQTRRARSLSDSNHDGPAIDLQTRQLQERLKMEVTPIVKSNEPTSSNSPSIPKVEVKIETKKDRTKFKTITGIFLKTFRKEKTKKDNSVPSNM